MKTDMKLYTLNTLPNTNYEVLGIVSGSIVQSKHIGRDFMAGIKTIVGGELKGYTEMLDEARNISTERMVEEAKKMGANAVIGISYSSSSVMQGATEVLAYGTAIIIR